MIPGRLKKDPKVLILTMIITFFSGGNFFALIFFWPTQSYNIYGNDPIGVGIRGLPIGFCIIGGAVISLVLIGLTKGRIRGIMVFFTALMTAGTGAMAIVEVYNLETVYAVLTLACIGVGGVIVPCSVIVSIICPDDLIATVTALTLSVRVLGGAIGFSIYYNVFYDHFVPLATEYVGFRACVYQLIILNRTLVEQLVTLAGNGEFRELRELTNTFENTPNAYEVIIGATQVAFAKAYKWVYYISIAFGGISFIAACFLGDIKKYMVCLVFFFGSGSFLLLYRSCSSMTRSMLTQFLAGRSCRRRLPLNIFFVANFLWLVRRWVSMSCWLPISWLAGWLAGQIFTT